MRLEDFALLAGSIASFLGLAGAMYLTRNLDWYGGKPRQSGGARRPVPKARASQAPRDRQVRLGGA